MTLPIIITLTAALALPPSQPVTDDAASTGAQPSALDADAHALREHPRPQDQRSALFEDQPPHWRAAEWDHERWERIEPQPRGDDNDRRAQRTAAAILVPAPAGAALCLGALSWIAWRRNRAA